MSKAVFLAWQFLKFQSFHNLLCVPAVAMIKQLPQKQWTTGSDPNSAVRNAIQVGHIAAASQRIKHQTRPPSTSTAIDRYNASKQRAAQTEAAGHQGHTGLRKGSVNCNAAQGKQASSLLVHNSATTTTVPKNVSAKGSAISCDTPNWFHMDGITLVPKRVQGKVLRSCTE